VTEPSLLATFQVAETIDSFNASNFTLQLAQASGVAPSAITLNIMSGSLTVTASFYISSADRSRVQDTLDQQASALSAMLGVTVLSTPTIQLVEPQPLPYVGDSAAALLTLDGALPSSPTLLMIALILAGVANVACAIGCTMYVVLRRRRIRRAKERFGAAAERAAEKKHSIDIEMTKHPSAAIAASEAACREVMRKHLKDYMHANGCNANFKAWIATLHPENVQLDQRMWLDQGEQITLWRELSGNDAPPPSPPKVRAPDAPSTLTPTARSAESPSSSLPVLDLKLSELKGRDPDDAPMATLRKGAPDSLRRKTVGSLPELDLKLSELKGRDPDDAPMATLRKGAPDSLRCKTVGSLGRSSERSPSKILRRGRSSETPETPSSAGVATTPLMSNVTTPDNSTADVTA
jgi:hypothetical protein